MSGIEDATPSFVDDEVRQQYTTSALLGELTAFANNNPRFAAREIDQIILEFQETEILRGPLSREAADIVREMDPEEREDFLAQNLGRVMLKYKFFVERLPGLNGRRHLGFEFSAISVVSGMGMPPQIARHAYPERSVDEAIMVLGPSMFEKELNFNISSEDRSLDYCQQDTYYDQDNDPVNVSCTCTLHDHEHAIVDSLLDLDALGITFEEAIAVEEEGFGSLLEADEPQERKNLNEAPITLERMEREKVAVNTPEEALALWSSFEQATVSSLDFALESDRHDEYLHLAFGVLRNIKRILREQAGIK